MNLVQYLWLQHGIGHYSGEVDLSALTVCVIVMKDMLISDLNSTVFSCHTAGGGS